MSSLDKQTKTQIIRDAFIGKTKDPLVAEAFNLYSAIQMGFSIDLDEVDWEIFEAMKLIHAERQNKQLSSLKR